MCACVCACLRACVGRACVLECVCVLERECVSVCVEVMFVLLSDRSVGGRVGSTEGGKRGSTNTAVAPPRSRSSISCAVMAVKSIK